MAGNENRERESAAGKEGPGRPPGQQRGPAAGRDGARAARARRAPLRSGARGCCRRAAMTSRQLPPIAGPGRSARAPFLWRAAGGVALRGGRGGGAGGACGAFTGSGSVGAAAGNERVPTPHTAPARARL